MIEVEHVESALSILAQDGGETFVSRAVAASSGFPHGLFTVPFAEPLFDTIALVQRDSAVLSPATREIARVARQMLLDATGDQAR